jgi:hypothetical protein
MALFKKPIFLLRGIGAGFALCSATFAYSYHLTVLRIQTLLIRIWIMLFTLIRIRIWILLFSLIRIRLFYTGPDPYRFKKVMHLKQYPTYFYTS